MSDIERITRELTGTKERVAQAIRVMQLNPSAALSGAISLAALLADLIDTVAKLTYEVERLQKGAESEAPRGDWTAERMG